MFNNASSFFNIAMYDAIKNSLSKGEENNVDQSGNKESGDGNRKVEGQCDRDVPVEKDGCSKKEPQKNKTTRTVSKKKPVSKKTGDKIDDCKDSK